MQKINIKNIYIKTSIFVFSFFCLFCFPIYKIFAALEVDYPEISGASLSEGSKLPDLVLYIFNLGMSISLGSVFISLAIAGVMYSLSPVNAGLKAEAKDRVGGAISGLLLLLLTYLILTTINPEFKNFNLTRLPNIDTPPTEEPIYPGVSFNGGTSRYLSNINDLGTLKNKVKSVEIVDDENTSFITVLYDNTNLWGKCLYLANSSNEDVKWAASASIHQINDDSNGDGVYFYRKSFFDKKGGFLKVSNSEIKDVYVGELATLKFTESTKGKSCNVPDEEQNCIKYDKNGKCCTEENSSLGCKESGLDCPTLANNEISSVEIKGDYVVIFVYFSPTDDEKGPWTACQEFPAIDDVNKIGPQQIKWQNIRNTTSINTTENGTSIGGLVPNYVIIVPI